MTYDDTARKVAIKAIGTVESGLTYDSINYNDPITVGVGQWYGTRAASLLVDMRDHGTWTGVASSLTDDLSEHSASSAWWNNRYLVKAEGVSLKPMLMKNKAIQNSTFADDIDDYKDIAVRLGMDADSNTDAMLLWMVAYHQSPKRANQVLARYGPDSSLDRLLSGFLNEPVLGQYRTRYNTAYNIIKAQDTSGVDDLDGETSEDDDGDVGGNAGSGRLTGEFSHIRRSGNSLLAMKSDGSAVNFLHTGPNTYSSGQDSNTGATVVDDDDGTTPVDGTMSEKQKLIRDFVISQEGRWNYGNGPGRLTPEKSGYCDCSSFLRYAFKKILGITLGTYTVAQMNDGTRIASGSGSLPLSRMEIGDLILFDWAGYGRNTVDHVEMYMGDGRVSGHGGGASGTVKGPTFKPAGSANQMANRAVKWFVQRVIK